MLLAQIQVIAAEGPNGKFIPSDPKEMYWAILAFSVIFFFFLRKGLPLIREALNKGQAAAVAAATAAEDAIVESRTKIAEATAQLGDADAAVESMKTQAVADIQAEVAAQAVGAAEQVVHASLDDAGHSALVDTYIERLGASS
jgi:F0F1-type ATP synthase membrane subunit b/b'